MSSQAYLNVEIYISKNFAKKETINDIYLNLEHSQDLYLQNRTFRER